MNIHFHQHILYIITFFFLNINKIIFANLIKFKIIVDMSQTEGVYINNYNYDKIQNHFNKENMFQLQRFFLFLCDFETN